MKCLILLSVLLSVSVIASCQQVLEADRLVSKGIAYHDRGDFDRAIELYDSALLADKDNIDAMAEKAMSLLSAKKIDEAIAMCELTIAKHSGRKELRNVFVTYGNAYDAARKPDKSLQIYNEGIKQFPDYYQLHFNKGITLVGQERIDESINCFQTAATLNPEHASSHNALGRLMSARSQRVPALLAYTRFLIIESGSRRAKENITALQTLLKANVSKNDDKNITINIDPAMLGDKKSKKKDRKEKKENDFSAVDLFISMSAALDFDKKYENEKRSEYLERKLTDTFSVLSELKKDNVGFYWSYYTPYFIEIKDKNMMKTLANLILAGSGDQDVSAWLQSHEKEIADFQSWSKNFNWNIDK